MCLAPTRIYVLIRTPSLFSSRKPVILIFRLSKVNFIRENTTHDFISFKEDLFILTSQLDYSKFWSPFQILGGI